MSAQEDVAAQPAEHAKHALVVLGDLGVELVADELVARVHVGAADDHDVERLAAFGHLHRPGRAALGVARGQVRDQRRTAELDLVAIVEHAIDLGRRVQPLRLAAVLKVRLAAGFDDGHVAIHHHVARPR